MFDYLKKMFSIPFEPENIPLQKNVLGALRSEPDVRTIPFYMVRTPKPIPSEYMTDVSMFPKWYQGNLGTCVSHAFMYTKMIQDFQETKSILPYSRRFHYALCRKYMNADKYALSEGTTSEIGAKIVSSIGSLVDEKNEDNTLSHEKYTKYEITPKMVTEANIGRVGGYGWIDVTVSEMQQALIKIGAFPVTVKIDFQKIDIDGRIRPIKNLDGYHEITCIGYDTNFGGRFIFKNWWYGYENMYITYEDLEKVVIDATFLYDIPNDLIERAKQTKYLFLKDLSIGSRGEAVSQLQKRLIEYGVFPIYQEVTTYFGAITAQAVRDFQRLKGLPITGNFGPLTRTMMNQDAGLNEKVKKSKLDLWCEAIAKMENAKPELNNPGNIKWIGQANAIGKDYRNIAIFPDYPTGYAELRKMLVRACSGGSKIYKPTDSLLGFFEKYAPSSDNNNPKKYAEFVAKYMGVDINTQISSFLL